MPPAISAPKVIGVGMSKTGTTTLGLCLELLGLGPHRGFDAQLADYYYTTGDSEPAVAAAAGWRSLEDAPWYRIYKRLDACYPGSKFVLTLRKDSETHAVSSWEHGVRAGYRRGPCPAHYLEQKVREYESHNDDVRRYFTRRPQDLLIMCWENGDGWDQLCTFLGLPVPDVPIPHANRGVDRLLFPRLSGILAGTPALMFLRRMRHRVARVESLRSVRSRLFLRSSAVKEGPKSERPQTAR